MDRYIVRVRKINVTKCNNIQVKLRANLSLFIIQSLHNSIGIAVGDGCISMCQDVSEASCAVLFAKSLSATDVFASVQKRAALFCLHQDIHGHFCGTER